MIILSFPFLVFWAFLGLKLSGAWGSVSWWLVTLPLLVVGAAWVSGLIVVALPVVSSDNARNRKSTVKRRRDWL